MKDRPRKMITMQDVAASTKPEEKKSKIYMPDSTLVDMGGNPLALDSKGLDVEVEKRETYNKEILNLDEDYKNFVPYTGLVVRCFVLEAENLGGILNIPQVMVPYRTKNGMAYKSSDPSPYPYSRKAIVVSVQASYIKDFTPGDIILLGRHANVTLKENEESPFHVPKAFFLPTWQENEPPRDMKAKHFGYLRVNPMVDVEGFIYKQKN